MCEKKYNVAVIGCGGIATRHLNAIVAKEEAVLYAVCDNSEERMKKRQDTFSVPVGVTDYRELVNDPKVDVAVILTPDALHTEMTCAFLRAGKDVLLEKPMAQTLEECEEMMRVEKETGRRLMVGQVARYSSNFVQAKKIIDEGHLGELVFVESEYAHDYSLHPGFDSWRVDPRREGMIGGGCHAVDLLRWIAGDPTEVYAYSNHKYLTDWPVNDTTIAVYQFPNNVIGKVFCSIGVKRDYTMRTCIYGTKGTLIFDAKAPEMKLYECDAEGKGYTEPQIFPCNPKRHNMDDEFSDFLDALIHNTPMPIPAIEGASTVAVCRATVESAKQHKPIQIRYPQV